MTDKNKKEIIKIADMTPEGIGVGKLENGKALFVPLCAKNDIAEIVVIKDKSSYAIGKLLSLKKPSDDRTELDCSVFNKCGGCSLRHITEEAEKNLLYHYVEEALKRIGGVEVKVNPVISGKTKRYRNKGQYPLSSVNGKIICGFYEKHSHKIIEHEDCLLQPEYFKKTINTIIELLEKYNISSYDEMTNKGVARHIVLRENYKEQLSVMLVINGESFSFQEKIAEELMEKLPYIISFGISVNTKKTNVINGEKYIKIKGEDYLEDTLCGKKFKISPLAFYQVNRTTAELLYNKVKELLKLKIGDVLLDLYCGIGTIGLSVCDNDNLLCGVEIIPDAVRDARINALLNGRNENNTRFTVGDASAGIEYCKMQFGKIDCMVVDPPRKGLSSDLIDKIIKENIKKIVYVSCNPATMARDLAIFAKNGYTFGEVSLFNMFPRAGHIEAVCLISREF